MPAAHVHRWSALVVLVGACTVALIGCSTRQATADPVANPPARQGAPAPLSRASEIEQERKDRGAALADLPDECVCTASDRTKLGISQQTHVFTEIDSAFRALGRVPEGDWEKQCHGDAAVCIIEVQVLPSSGTSKCVAQLNYCRLCVRSRDRAIRTPWLAFRIRNDGTSAYTFHSDGGIRLLDSTGNELASHPSFDKLGRSPVQHDLSILRPTRTPTSGDLFHDAKVLDKNGNPCDFKDPLIVNTSN